MKTATKASIGFVGVASVLLAVALNGQPGASLAEEPSETPTVSQNSSETPSASEAPSETATPTETPTATPTPTPTPTPTKPPPDPRLVTSVTIAVIENHGRVAVSQKMPKITAYGKRYAVGTQAYAITHPSKPNYLVLASGSMQGETSDRFATEKAPALFDLAAAKGWAGGVVRTYAQSMGSDNCRMSNRGAYVHRHNPGVSFTYGTVKLANGKTVTKRSLCETHNRDSAYWAADAAGSRLGVVNFIIPDNNHNWHDSPYSDAAAARSDAWIAARVAEFIKSPDYAAGGAFIITADEARPSSKVNDIPLIVIHKSLDGKHLSRSTRLNPYDMHAFFAEVAHLQTYSGPGRFANTFGLVPA